MRCSQERTVLFLLHFVLMLASGHGEYLDSGRLLSVFAEQGPSSGSDVSIVHPVKTSPDGEFLSHSLVHHFHSGERIRRDLRPHNPEERVHYKVDYRGRTLMFNLSRNTQLLSDDYVLETRNGSAHSTERRPFEANSCHLLGSVASADGGGTAAISTCTGLRGVFFLPGGHFFIEPLQKPPGDPAGTPEAHIIYPRNITGSHREKRSPDAKGTPRPCGVQDAPGNSVQVDREREEWEREQHRGEGQGSSRWQRSVSRERWVETMVVADSKLIQYHGNDNVESYIFTIMNMVAGIFHDASIGNAIHVILVRLILLQGEEKGLKIVHHADTTLSSFCAWQKNLNPQSDTHPAHHDLAVLVTRKDICAGLNQPCETLGLSHLSGMCQPHRSCNINEDSGLPVAFTIAHEMGHSFGIHHDGQGNDCELDGRHPFIMSRQLMYDSSPLTWSPCSKEYITRFLDRGWGFCLDDRPSKKELTTPLANLGVRYTTHHQCQLQYGPNATFCSEVDNVCQILWCSVNGSCRSKLDSPIDGTLCGPGKWCISGECVIVGKLPETVNGGWGPWTTWSYCSRTCGTGVQSAERECNSPKPEFGGKYCTGERKRYRTCNTKPCQSDRPTFREMLCSEFDTVPYHNELYQWIPVANPLNPCELHCRPVTEYFAEKMLDTVTDGTPCFMNNKSRNICVNGVCKEVGCDFGIDSNAMEDRCGVCLGDGSSCNTIYKSFDEEQGFGYMDVGVIPEGARDILVKEVEEAGNFLALKSEDSEEYYLNGNYIIQWNGEYEAGGTTFYYERSGNMENLTAPGPTKEPIMLQLLFQEKNPGLKYEYTYKKTKQTGNEVIQPVYTWRHGAWTHCSATCGLGEQHQPARCFQVDVGVVDESLCDAETQPEDRYRKCKNMDCPARWWVGGWQHCTATCGSDGVRTRTVLCVRTVSGEETVLHPVECKHLLKPKRVVPCNRDVPCGQEWTIGDWQECPVTCGGGVRSRTVTCALAPKKTCDLVTRPRSRSLCGLQSCPNSSLRRRPGSPPKYRRIYPPKSDPPQLPVSSTRAPTTTATPAVATTVGWRTTATNTPTAPSTTPPSALNTTVTDMIHTGDGGFDVDLNKKDKENILPKKSEKNRKAEKMEVEEMEEEEGSTAGVETYTPGYDYIIEDRRAEEEEIIDLDVVTTAPSLQPPVKPTPPTHTPIHTHTIKATTGSIHPNTSPGPGAPTHRTHGVDFTTTPSTLRKPSTTLRKPSTTLRKPSTTLRKPSTTLRKPSTTLRKPSTTLRKPSTTLRKPSTTLRKPSTTLRKPSTTAAAPQSTVNIKPKKSVTAKTETSTTRTKKTPPPHPPTSPPSSSPSPPSSSPSSSPSSPSSSSSASSASSSSWSKGGGSWSQHLHSEPPVNTSSSHKTHLMTKDPVSMEMFWVVGNWSESYVKGGRPPRLIRVRVRSQEQQLQLQQRSPDSPLPIHFHQLFRNVPRPAWRYNPSSVSWGPRGFQKDMPENTSPGRRPGDVFSRPPQLAPLDVKEQRPHSEPLPHVLAPPPISTKETHFSHLYQPPHSFDQYPECSTTCGIGAVWRAVTCSSQDDEDCANMQRPEPARTCHLQPCAAWHSGSWSKCPDTCAAAGRRYRDVQCVDSQSQRPLRPFHCQLVSSRPISTLTCPHRACLTWTTSPWGPCSGSCGKGARERLVYCPEPHRCSATVRPNSTEPCRHLRPCTQWKSHEWTECSVSCGGGQQQRDTYCVSVDDAAVMPNNLCEKKTKPDTVRRCSTQECKTSTGPVCRKNTMSSRFCDKLKLLGRCALRSVQRQCCVTCGP